MYFSIQSNCKCVHFSEYWREHHWTIGNCECPACALKWFVCTATLDYSIWCRDCETGFDSTYDYFKLKNRFFDSILWPKFYTFIFANSIFLAISLPSAEYSLQLSNTSICSLDQKTSKVYAMALGTTEITLIDSSKFWTFKVLKFKTKNLYTKQGPKMTPRLILWPGQIRRKGGPFRGRSPKRTPKHMCFFFNFCPEFDKNYNGSFSY